MRPRIGERTDWAERAARSLGSFEPGERWPIGFSWQTQAQIYGAKLVTKKEKERLETVPLCRVHHRDASPTLSSWKPLRQALLPSRSRCCACDPSTTASEGSASTSVLCS